MYSKKQIGGARAKQHGEEFENMLRHPATRQGFVLVRMPDGCRMVRRGRSVVALRVATPMDFILTRRDLGVAFFDCKSTGGGTFSYSDITPHQIRALAELRQQGNAAGYVIFFRRIDYVAWYTVERLMQVRPRESVRPEDGVHLGGILSVNLERLFPVKPARSQSTGAESPLLDPDGF